MYLCCYVRLFVRVVLSFDVCHSSSGIIWCVFDVEVLVGVATWCCSTAGVWHGLYHWQHTSQFIMEATSNPSICLSVCPSVPCLQLSWNRKAIETTNLMETQHWTTATSRVNMWFKGTKTGNENVKIVFTRIFIKCRSIYVRSRQNDQRPILHISIQLQDSIAC